MRFDQQTVFVCFLFFGVMCQAVFDKDPVYSLLAVRFTRTHRWINEIHVSDLLKDWETGVCLEYGKSRFFFF